ncbi:polysaccharide pyruvyl transferase CsaB [bacterium 1xD42-67]|nr:polysaccharide pyruvyl transferase CsaB [bacterium 1xD42-67]
MKILMATMGLDIGGAETHIVELSKALKALGHEVAVVSNGGVYVPEIQAAGIRHYSAPLDQRSLTAMFRARRVLKQILRRERPDIVHAHARIPAFLCGTLGGRERYAFVTSCHGVYQVSGMLKLLSNWGEHALAVSEDIRDYLMEQYGVPEEQIALTINGIDTERFSPAVSGEAVRAELGLGEGPVVGHVSRLDRAASHTARQLIAIAPRLCAQVPGLQIVIAGGGDVYEELAALARQANERIGRAGVVLTGPRTDVDRILAACCLFVGVSRAALEAMAAGKPAVLSGAQGHTGLFTPELLDKAVDTNFCCRTDPVSTQDQLLEDILAALALPPERRAELGAFGRQVVQERYSVSRMARDALSVYDRVRRRRYRVVMSGYYGFGNAGDDAILESIHQSIRSASDEVAVTVLSNDPELTRKQYGLEAVPRFRALRVFRALWKGDALLSGGGSLLQDATSTRSLVYYLSVIHCARLLHKPVMLYANGIGPVRDPANRRRVRRAVERAALVTLRDHASARELAEMGVERPVQVTADPVFRLEPTGAERSRALCAAAGLPQGRPFAAVSVRDWDNVGDFFAQLAGLCDHLRRAHGLEILFLLMQPARDREATDRVRARMEEPSYVLEEPCVPRELMGVLGQARLCLAMRLHTLIFAARMAVPAMGLVYDPKVSSYLEELELPSAGDVERFDGAEAIRRADALMADYDAVLARLREKSAQLAQAAEENERLLLELLEKTKR